MTKLLYARMGRDNLRRNYRLYLPYLLACGGTVAMYYILSALAFGDVIGQEGLSFGTQYLKVMMEMGLYVVGLFACVFLFYTHAFLTKGRQQEFGLYNILGMEKRHIGRMMLYETLYAYLISLAGGVAGGALLTKLLALFALRLMRMEGDAALTIQWQAVASTAALFGGIFALTWLRDLLAIHLSSPAQLLRGGQAGEKEPRARWLLALLGLAFLGSGYALALLCSQPVTALLMFFPAAALVVLGTYCLFTWGSVALVKLLRKNKAYYYQPNHFICVSGMMYRMKQNGVGLANICILCTMVLVMLSSTVSLYAGVEDSVARALPRQVNLWVEVEQDLSGLEAARDQALEEADGQVYLDETEDLYCVWRGAYSRRRRICGYGIDLFARQEDGSWMRGEEYHEEYAYTMDELTAWLEEAGFTDIRQFGNLRMTPPQEDERRVFFTATKKG